MRFKDVGVLPPFSYTRLGAYLILPNYRHTVWQMLPFCRPVISSPGLLGTLQQQLMCTWRQPPCCVLYDEGCVCSGQVPAAPFRLGSSQDNQHPSAVHAWLEQAHTDSPIDQVPDVVIETGVFKVHSPVTHTTFSA